MRIMDLVRKHILYRNIPKIDTSPQVFAIKNEISKEALKNDKKKVEVNKAVEKSNTYFIAKGMGIIK